MNNFLLYFRWRILEGIDPEKSQLVAKNQALQKQLIHKMKQLDEKEVELQENIRKNQELADQLKRRSEANSQEKLWACNKELSSRIERIKVLSGENDMFQSLCVKYRNEIMSLRDELRKFKLDEFKSRTSKKRKT